MKVYSHGFFAMNTRFNMVIPDLDSARGDVLGRISAQIVESWEQRLSRFRSGAELQIINELAYERDLLASEAMNRVLDICDSYHRLTKGLFDPAVNQGKGRWKDVIRDREKGSVRFAREGVKLDFGGIGKGIALEDVVSYLKLEDVVDAFLSFGESSIAGMGKHPHGEGWLVGSSKGFLLSDAFISVSGLLNQGGTVEPALKAHIYHPLKGELITTKRRVMVESKSAVEAEVLSTCAYMADEKEFEVLKMQFPDAQWQVD